ncbi:hypothetical protein TWF730_011218 [Orbilia blumenaviensis]|uniref:Uncharacterized protein n=1 Tax=Orbilia blumenaviensis TaxID=1796055 RepID=A0AAV9UN52_9PEZI
MRVGVGVVYAALSVLSVSQVVDALKLSLKNNLNRQLQEDIERKKLRINGHITAKLGKGSDGKIIFPAGENKLVLPTEHQMETPLDHSGETTEMFNQTYWVYDKHYKPGGPVFVYHSGESDITDFAEVWLNSSLIDNFQQEFGGLGIVLQHRYYGRSTPRYAWAAGETQINGNTQAEQFQYLTTEQALEDVKYFADRFNYTSERVPVHIDVTAKGSPWVMVGASYSGNLVSFLRRKYPDTFFAAYSSSAPVEARADMSVYWDVLSRAIGREEPACIEKVRSATQYIDQELEKGDQESAVIKQLFLGVGGEVNTHGWFTDTLTYAFFDYQWAGINRPLVENTVYTIKHLCDHLNTDPSGQLPTDPSPPKDGKWLAERWATWPGYIAIIKDLGYECGGFGSPKRDCQLAIVHDNAENLAWIWQSCYEWGYFQVGNPGPNQMASKFSNVEHWKTKCQLDFNDPTAKQFLPIATTPKANDINKLYGGWSDPQPRTFYTVGEKDPWSPLGFIQTDLITNATDSPPFVANSTIPSCEANPSEVGIFGFVIKDALHTADMVAGTWSNETLPLFTAALKSWLPCFKPSRKLRGGPGEAEDKEPGPGKSKQYDHVPMHQYINMRQKCSSKQDKLANEL